MLCPGGARRRSRCASMDTRPDPDLMKKAAALLARRPLCRADLGARLARAAPGTPVEPVLDRLEQLDLLNDAEYAYNFALHRMKRQGWGPARVDAALGRVGVPPPVIDAALGRVRGQLGEDAGLGAEIDRLWARRGVPRTPAEARSLADALARRGFARDRISAALRRRLPAALARRFDTGD